MTTPVHTGGFTPTVKIEPANPEAEKYLKIWSHAAYRAVAAGLLAGLRLLGVEAALAPRGLGGASPLCLPHPLAMGGCA